MALSASTKYLVISVLTGVIAVVEYFATHDFVLSEATVAGAVILAAGLAIHDLEG